MKHPLLKNIQTHNVVEIEKTINGGLLLHRFPSSIRSELSSLGKMVGQDSSGSEIRFVTRSKNFRISLSPLPSVLQPYENHPQDLILLRGPYVHSHHRLESGKINHVQVINISGIDRFDSFDLKKIRHGGFSPAVWRVFFGRYPVVFHGIDTFGEKYRRPTPSETPSVKWLAYGSSITNGASPTNHLQSYIYHAARIAGIDVFNQGLSGSCLCEPIMANYLSHRKDWDIITLEIGINMRGSTTPQEFQKKAEFMIEKICKRHPQKKVFLITIFPNFSTPGLFPMKKMKVQNSVSELITWGKTEEAFNRILREMYASKKWKNLCLIEGCDLLDEMSGLTTDLLHPSDYGHSQMGIHLGKILLESIKQKRLS